MTADACRPGDAKCPQGGFDTPLALGAIAKPETRIQMHGTTGPGFHYESAAPGIVEVTDGRVIGKAEGTSALLFVSDGGAVLDFLHVWVKKPTGLVLHATAPGREGEGEVDDTIELVPGDSIWIDAELTAEGQHLTGTSATEWSIEPPIALALRGGAEGKRRIVAQHPGKAVVRVKSLGLESTVELWVRGPGDGVEPSKVAAPAAKLTKGGA